MGPSILSEKATGNYTNSFLMIAVEALEGAYELAKKLGENKLTQELLCNLGIVKGNMAISNFTDKHLASIVRTGKFLSCKNSYF